jgi:hypothetical protein
VADKVFDGFWVSTAYRIADKQYIGTVPGKARGKRPPDQSTERTFVNNLIDGMYVKSAAPVLPLIARSRLGRAPPPIVLAFSHSRACANGCRTWALPLPAGPWNTIAYGSRARICCCS